MLNLQPVKLGTYFETHCIMCFFTKLLQQVALLSQRSRAIIIIKNECHSNIIVDRLQGCDASCLSVVSFNSTKVQNVE